LSRQHGLKHDSVMLEAITEFSMQKQGQEDCVDGDRSPSMRRPGLCLVLEQG